MAKGETSPAGSTHIRKLASGLLVGELPNVAVVELDGTSRRVVRPTTVVLARLACSSSGFSGSALIGAWPTKHGDQALAIHVVGNDVLDKSQPFAVCSSFELSESGMRMAMCHRPYHMLHEVREDNYLAAMATDLLTEVHDGHALPLEGAAIHETYKELLGSDRHEAAKWVVMDALERLDPMSVVNS